MTVVSNTSPLRYLTAIDQIDLLPQLYERVMIPQAVYDELSSPGAPETVRSWIARLPHWLEIESVTTPSNIALERLDRGEREAILLAEQLGIDSILLDDMAGRRVARERGLRVIGVLGILGDAATLGLVDFATAIERLRETNGYHPACCSPF